jgi:hypothetical protein
MFDKLVWHTDRMLLDDLVFRLEYYKNAAWHRARTALHSISHWSISMRSYGH